MWNAADAPSTTGAEYADHTKHQRRQQAAERLQVRLSRTLAAFATTPCYQSHESNVQQHACRRVRARSSLRAAPQPHCNMTIENREHVKKRACKRASAESSLPASRLRCPALLLPQSCAAPQTRRPPSALAAAQASPDGPCTWPRRHRCRRASRTSLRAASWARLHPTG